MHPLGRIFPAHIFHESESVGVRADHDGNRIADSPSERVCITVQKRKECVTIRLGTDDSSGVSAAILVGVDKGWGFRKGSEQMRTEELSGSNFRVGAGVIARPRSIAVRTEDQVTLASSLDELGHFKLGEVAGYPG